MRNPEGHERPAGVDDDTVAAVGLVGEAMDTIIRARGHLYSFHQLTGKADLQLGEAVDKLRDAGHTEVADRLETELVGRNVLAGRWTFQLVEEYDETYHEPFAAAERRVRDELVGGIRHLAEAEMKRDRVTPGRRHHELDPDSG